MCDEYAPINSDRQVYYGRHTEILKEKAKKQIHSGRKTLKNAYFSDKN